MNTVIMREQIMEGLGRRIQEKAKSIEDIGS